MPFKKGQGGRPKGAINHATREIQAIARALVEDQSYVRSLKKRLVAGKAPHIEAVLFYYAYGKPKESHEHSGTVAIATTVVHEHHAKS